MIATGFPYPKCETEIIDLINPSLSCQLYTEETTQQSEEIDPISRNFSGTNDIPEGPGGDGSQPDRPWAWAKSWNFAKYDSSQRSDTVGGFVQGHPLICGGKYYGEFFQDCYVIGKPANYFNTKLLQDRRWASSVVLYNSVLWIVGGVDQNSTEFVYLDRPPSRGPELPFNIFSHSMIQYSPTAIYIIGGFQNCSISNRTWIVDPTNWLDMVEGPRLNYERCRHSCSKMKINGKTILVVAGGTGANDSGDTVELLDPTSDKGWIIGNKYENMYPRNFFKNIILGPRLPCRLERSAMVPSPSGHGVVLIGGKSVYSYRKIMASTEINVLLELTAYCKPYRVNPMNSLEWIELDQKLEYSRCSHIAFIIDDDLTISHRNYFDEDEY